MANKMIVLASGVESSGNGTAIESETQSQSSDSTDIPTNLFYDHYVYLCEKLSCSSFLRGHNQPKYVNRAILSLVSDRLLFGDWSPIVRALHADRSLHLIEIKARKQLRTIYEKLDTERKIRLVLSGRQVSGPAAVATTAAVLKNFNFLQTRFVLDGLVEALVAGPISQSNVLSYVCLNGVRLAAHDLDRLLIAVEKAGRLQHLSFERCSIGDEGCELIYQRLKNVPSLSSINVAGCGLTRTGLGQIASLIKFQKNQRFCEIWKISLRNRTANLNEMQGLRHVIVNNNPEIGDDGCRDLIEVLFDDLWLKSIELQNCGLTNQSSELIRQLFAANRTLERFDCRDNRKLSARFSTEAVRAGTATDSLFSSDDSKENSVAVANNGESKPMNVVPFRSRYKTDNYELLNAKQTISSLQQQLKREQSRNERLKIVRKTKQVPAASEFHVVIDVRHLTEFMRGAVIENESFCASDFRVDFKAFLLPIVRAQSRLLERFVFDEQAVLWRPKNDTETVIRDSGNNESRTGIEMVNDEIGDNESDCLTWPRTFSNFISCDGDNERSDSSMDERLTGAACRAETMRRTDSDSFVIKELLKSFQ